MMQAESEVLVYSPNLRITITMPPRKKSILEASNLLHSELVSPARNGPAPLAIYSMTRTQSLYQRCLSALDQLLRLDRILDFYDLIDSGRVQSRVGLEPIDYKSRMGQLPDPVRLLWDLLALGVPLCILFNSQPRVEPLQIDVSCKVFEWNLMDIKHTKRAAALFIMGVNGLIKSGEWDYPLEMFTVSELLGNDTNGFVKVVNIVLYLLERLPKSKFSSAPPSMPYLASNQYRDPLTSDPVDNLASPTENKASEDESSRNRGIQCIINAERKYIADLEVMYKYAQELVKNDILGTDTVHHLFPGLSKLLDFGRKFLIEMEGVIRRPWEEQRWGELFIKHEQEFEAYQPYCANYANAVDLMMAQEQNLMALSRVINPQSELPMFLIKPIQKIWTYQLLLQDLVKYVNESTYPYYNELERGIAVAKRIADRANEAQRKAENLNKLKMLLTRVEDWKGHRPQLFGELLLDEKLDLTMGEVNREYHVFLFEKIILCCKISSASSQESSKGRAGKENPTTTRRSVPAEAQNISYMLKGRIFVSKLAKTSTVPGECSLQVWWRGDEETESMTLHFRSEERHRLWQTNIDQLIAKSPVRPSKPEQVATTLDQITATSTVIPQQQNAPAQVASTTSPRSRPEPTSRPQASPPGLLDRSATNISMGSPRLSLEGQRQSGLFKGINSILFAKKNRPTSISSPISPTTIDLAPTPPTKILKTPTSHLAVISSFMLCEHGCQDVTGRLDIDSSSTFPLSSGGFGDVYRGRFKDATPIAIKTMRLQISSTELGQKSLKYAARELHIWSKCQHPNVLPLLGLVVFRDQIGMASQWLERGSLPSYIEQNPDFDPYKMSVGIASGLAYLHSTGIVHGDLKGLNILVSDEGTPMLTDFGNAVLQDCTLNFTATTQKSSLSLRWAAPELLDGREVTYSTAADVYALGMTVLETFTGKVPFFGSVDIAVMSAVIFRKEIPARPEAQIPSNSREGDLLWSLLNKCWTHEPKDRPNSLEVEAEMRKITCGGLTHNTTSSKYI
ncbi:hypothetical protein FRC12_008844 [Ceratobasidium sp. 428]|nr:hypothetical protein FRC12_008844 [Ceratobasidium sp. 428]